MASAKGDPHRNDQASSPGHTISVTYQCGKINQSDYLSRHVKPIEQLPHVEQQEPDDLNNLLYMLHTTPIIDCMGIGTVAQATKNDPILTKIGALINQGSLDRKIRIERSPTLPECTI